MEYSGNILEGSDSRLRSESSQESITRIAAAMDPERLYATVLALEGPRNILTAPTELDAAAGWIKDAMITAGLQVRELTFGLEGTDYRFRILEGAVGASRNEPARVIIAHYDTVEASMGANDNAAGIALILEVGRALAQLPDPPHVRIVAVPQEESTQPAFKGKEIESLRRLGLVDANQTPTTWAGKRTLQGIHNKAMTLFNAGSTTQGHAYACALADWVSREGPVPVEIDTHFRELAELYADMDPVGTIGVRSRIGSTRWLEAFLAEGGSVAFALSVDEPGIHRNEPGSQDPVPQGDFKDMTRSHLLQPEARVGNFAVLASIAGSSHLARRLADMFEQDDINMPYGWFDLPLDFKGTAQHLPKILGSDHAPFWREGIPAVFLFDMSLGRDPWNHTLADTIDRLNFDALLRQCRAVFQFLSVSNLETTEECAL